MAANSLLKQYSDERAALVQNAVSKAAAIVLGRRRVLSGIRWRDDLIVTAAEAIGGAEQVGIRLDPDDLEAQVIATALTTDIALLRVNPAPANTTANATNGNPARREGSSGATANADVGGGSTGSNIAATSATPRPTPSLLRVGE